MSECNGTAQAHALRPLGDGKEYAGLGDAEQVYPLKFELLDELKVEIEVTHAVEKPGDGLGSRAAFDDATPRRELQVVDCRV